MITTRAMPALLPAHHQRVASETTIKNDFADPLAPCRHRQAARQDQIRGMRAAIGICPPTVREPGPRSSQIVNGRQAPRLSRWLAEHRFRTRLVMWP
jgi:hypothetical protein